MTFDEQVAFLNDEANRSKILQAACLAAANVAAEASTVAHHTLRADLATKVLNGPLGWEEAFARDVTAQPGMTTTATDSDIQFTVNALWNAIAGAPGPA